MRLMYRLTAATAFLMVCVAAPVASAQTKAAASAPNQSAAPDAVRISRVDFRDGYFQSEGGEGRWVEHRSDGSVAYRFVLRGISGNIISLFDDSRNTGVNLDITRRMILISFNGAHFEDLYPITATVPAGGLGAAVQPQQKQGAIFWDYSKDPMPAYGSQMQFKIEAGPIKNQTEASRNCVSLAHRVHGAWLGGWERRDGVNSICVIDIPR